MFHVEVWANLLYQAARAVSQRQTRRCWNEWMGPGLAFGRVDRSRSARPSPGG